MNHTSLVRKLADKGIPSEHIAIMLEALEEEAQITREGARMRKRAQREKSNENNNPVPVTSRDIAGQAVTSCDKKGSSPTLPLPFPPKIPPIPNPSLTPPSKKEYSSDFENFWRAYPKNRGPKVKAWERYQTAIKQKVLPATLLEGAQRYAAQCVMEGTEEQYIAHGSTWLNQRRWEKDDGGGGAAPVERPRYDKMPNVAGG